MTSKVILEVLEARTMPAVFLISSGTGEIQDLSNTGRYNHGESFAGIFGAGSSLMLNPSDSLYSDTDGVAGLNTSTDTLIASVVEGSAVVMLPAAAGGNIDHAIGVALTAGFAGTLGEVRGDIAVVLGGPTGGIETGIEQGGPVLKAYVLSGTTEVHAIKSLVVESAWEVMADGPISNLTATGSLQAVLTGSAIENRIVDFGTVGHIMRRWADGPTGGSNIQGITIGALAPNGDLKISAGNGGQDTNGQVVAAGSVKNVSIQVPEGSGRIEIEAGDGSLTGRGGDISDVSIIGTNMGIIQIAAGDSAYSPHAKVAPTGGNVSNLNIESIDSSEYMVTVVTAGSGAMGKNGPGAGGSITGTNLLARGESIITSYWDVTLQAAYGIHVGSDGAKKAVGGAGGSVFDTTATTYGPKYLNLEIRGGDGGNAVGQSGIAGRGGDVGHVILKAVDDTYGSDDLFSGRVGLQAGDGGRGQGRVVGGAGGNLFGVVGTPQFLSLMESGDGGSAVAAASGKGGDIFGFQSAAAPSLATIEIRAGDGGQSSHVGGAGGSIRDGIYQATSLLAGDGGDGAKGSGGTAGSITDSIILLTHGSLFKAGDSENGRGGNLRNLDIIAHQASTLYGSHSQGALISAGDSGMGKKKGFTGGSVQNIHFRQDYEPWDGWLAEVGVAREAPNVDHPFQTKSNAHFRLPTKHVLSNWPTPEDISGSFPDSLGQPVVRLDPYTDDRGYIDGQVVLTAGSSIDGGNGGSISKVYTHAMFRDLVIMGASADEAQTGHQTKNAGGRPGSISNLFGFFETIVAGDGGSSASKAASGGSLTGSIIKPFTVTLATEEGPSEKVVLFGAERWIAGRGGTAFEVDGQMGTPGNGGNVTNIRMPGVAMKVVAAGNAGNYELGIDATGFKMIGRGGSVANVVAHSIIDRSYYEPPSAWNSFLAAIDRDYADYGHSVPDATISFPDLFGGVFAGTGSRVINDGMEGPYEGAWGLNGTISKVSVATSVGSIAAGYNAYFDNRFFTNEGNMVLVKGMTSLGGNLYEDFLPKNISVTPTNPLAAPTSVLVDNGDNAGVSHHISHPYDPSMSAAFTTTFHGVVARLAPGSDPLPLQGWPLSKIIPLGTDPRDVVEPTDTSGL